MRAGFLNKWVTIQTKPSTAQDEYGAPSTSAGWTDNTDLWAGIWPLRGSEYHQANQGKAEISHKIQMRWMPLADGSALNPRCRIKYHDPHIEEDRYFEIISVATVDERKHTVQLLCKEKV